MKNKKILITGIAGSVGSELARQLYKDNKVYGIDNNETGIFDLMQDINVYGRVGDIRNEKTIRDLFSDIKPQVVFHAAAYKHVSTMEYVPEEAVETNILGTLNVIRHSKIYPVEKFIFISTDKATSPHSIMGASKRFCEIVTKNQGFTVVRFGNVLGSRGSVIPIWQRQMNQNKPLTVTDKDMERYFMTIEEACHLVIEAAEIGEGGEIIILDMGKRVNVLDLAKQILKESKKDNEIEIIGKREGEQLIETIMFKEEEERAIRKGKFWLIK